MNVIIPVFQDLMLVSCGKPVPANTFINLLKILKKLKVEAAPIRGFLIDPLELGLGCCFKAGTIKDACC